MVKGSGSPAFSRVAIAVKRRFVAEPKLVVRTAPAPQDCAQARSALRPRSARRAVSSTRLAIRGSIATRQARPHMSPARPSASALWYAAMTAEPCASANSSSSAIAVIHRRQARYRPRRGRPCRPAAPAIALLSISVLIAAQSLALAASTSRSRRSRGSSRLLGQGLCNRQSLVEMTKRGLAVSRASAKRGLVGSSA